MSQLTVKNLYSGYGKVNILHDISLSIPTQSIVSIIGPNGAGKTTLLKTISGTIQNSAGGIFVDDIEISDKPSFARIGLGICHVPEGRQIFSSLNVRENLLIGAHSLGHLKKKEMDNMIEEIYHWFPRLKEREKVSGGSLSGGEQQMLAIGRALMGKPKILLLDEPSLGLSPLMTKTIFDVLSRYIRGNITVVLVEQNAKLALQISDFAYVLSVGKVLIQKNANELLNDNQLLSSYLGEKVGGL